MDVSTGVFLLRVIDILMEVSLHRPIAAGRVRIEPIPRLHGEVSSLLDRLDRAIFGRVEDDSPLATDPGDDGRPVFVIVAPARLALLAAPTGPAAQELFPAVFRLALVASGVVEASASTVPSSWRCIS